jgi:hypothetical protein
VFNPNLALIPAVIEPPQKWEVHLLKINQGILNEVRMHKHTYEAYKEKIKVENIIIVSFKNYKLKKRRCFKT